MTQIRVEDDDMTSGAVPGFSWSVHVAGGAQVPPGGLQHAGVDLCRGGGPGHRRGGPHHLLRRSEEPHPPGAADGTHRAQAAGPHRRHPGRGTRGEGERPRVKRVNSQTLSISSSHTVSTLCSSDLQPEPEQQAQRVQVDHRQQQRLPHVPQQPPHAARGREPHPAQDEHRLWPVRASGEQQAGVQGPTLSPRGPSFTHPPSEL